MNDHYFSTDPSSSVEQTRIAFPAWGHELTLVAATGVFSSRRLDLGTSVLFRSAAPDQHAESVVDLGCGWGPITAALAVSLPEAVVWAVDVNQRALETTAANAARLRIGSRVRTVTPEQVPEDLQVDEIWSNPPIHAGKQVLHDLLLAWLLRLRPGGRAVLVIGKNLGADSLQRWLAGQGHPCERLASAKGFRVLEVHRPT
ncbi:MAG: class I SAM-dependent methyltransferase [Nocardioidaceae bacterium]